MDDQTFQDRILPRLLEVHHEALDPNVIAAYVAGTLSGAERADTERRLAADPEAALLVRALREESGESAAPATILTQSEPQAPTPMAVQPSRETPRVAPGWWASAAAAIALFVVGLVALTLRPATEQPDAATRLARAAEALRTAAPEHFASFTPLSASELEPRGGAIRGGVVWVGPRGVVLEAPRSLRWRGTEEGERAELRLVGPGVSWTKEVSGSHVAVSDLGPGRYVVTIRLLDSLAAQVTRRTFEIADAETVARHEEALALIEEHAPRGMADVLVAHYAIRSRLFEHAGVTVAQATSRDPSVREALEALARHVGDAP